MKKFNIILFIPAQERRNTPYSGDKSAARHDAFISYFPKNTRFYLATYEDQYIAEDIFLPDYIRVWYSWERYLGKQVHADLILWMSGRVESQKIYLNPIKDFCKNKTCIESIFPHATLHSHICHSYEEIIHCFHKISSCIKVYKPCFGSRAIGIVMSETLPKQEELVGEYPYLIQNFFDTSAGFEWHLWIHDFRVVILNGTITGSFLRIAPPWVMTANVATWASIIDFEWKIPSSIKKIIGEVEVYISKLYPERYYSIDVWIWQNWEVKIFELNSNPMLSTPSIIEALAQHIIKNILKIS